MSNVANEKSGGVLHLGDSLRHRGRGPGIGPIAISLLLHLAVVGVFVAARITGDSEPVHYQQVAIHLVSPPPTVFGEPAPVETTAPVVATPKVEDVKIPAKEVPKPKAQTQSAVNPKVVSKPTAAKPAQGLNPKPGPVGGEGLNVDQDGIPFGYPDYLKNVILRLSSSLRWQGAANLTAEVGFYIKRDGTVGAVRVIRTSGNDAFDLAAVEAVENAGRAKVLGPLPRDWQGDRLKIQFTFVPSN
ncbi:MAG: TonB family protein [Longimicrobiales bacterium]